MINTQVSPEPRLALQSGRVGNVLADASCHGFDRSVGGVLDPDMITSALTALLTRYPEAPVAGVADRGTVRGDAPWFAIGAHPLLQGRSGIDLVVPEDRGSVIEAWDMMLVRGGCYNRASLMLALEADLARRRDRPERAMIFIDLDRFKHVNDTAPDATRASNRWSTWWRAWVCEAASNPAAATMHPSQASTAIVMTPRVRTLMHVYRQSSAVLERWSGSLDRSR
jgi:hypothetical protein